MRYKKMPITPELDELQQAGLVWYRCRDWDEGQYDTIVHCIVTLGHATIRDNVARGCFGIFLEE